EGEEALLLGFVQIRHCVQTLADPQLRSIILHAVEFIATGLDLVEHAIDDFDDTRLEAAQAARGEGRHEQSADPRMAFAVHLGDELHAHELVELLEAVTFRQLRRKPLGIGKNLVHVRVAAADDLRRAGGKDVERRPFGPLGENVARVLLELVAAEVDVNDFASVEFTRRRHDASGGLTYGDNARQPGGRAACSISRWAPVLISMRMLRYCQSLRLRSSWGMPGSRQIASPGFSCVSRTPPSSKVISFLPSVSGTMSLGSRCWCHG